MKFAFLVSGAAGFCLVALVGLASGREIDPVLRDASVACLLCAFVGRWFWRGCETAFAQTLADRRAAAEAVEAESASAPVPAGASVAAARAAASPNKASASAKATASPPAATAARR